MLKVCDTIRTGLLNEMYQKVIYAMKLWKAYGLFPKIEEKNWSLTKVMRTIHFLISFKIPEFTGIWKDIILLHTHSENLKLMTSNSSNIMYCIQIHCLNLFSKSKLWLSTQRYWLVRSVKRQPCCLYKTWLLDKSRLFCIRDAQRRERAQPPSPWGAKVRSVAAASLRCEHPPLRWARKWAAPSPWNAKVRTPPHRGVRKCAALTERKSMMQPWNNFMNLLDSSH